MVRDCSGHKGGKSGNFGALEPLGNFGGVSEKLGNFAEKLGNFSEKFENFFFLSNSEISVPVKNPGIVFPLYPNPNFWDLTPEGRPSCHTRGGRQELGIPRRHPLTVSVTFVTFCHPSSLGAGPGELFQPPGVGIALSLP